MPVCANDPVISWLQALPLLTESQAVVLAEELAPTFADTASLLRELTQRGWLTDFQAEELLAGRGEELVLGSYCLMSPLGQGGMGRVYKARHVRLDRLVALKVLRPDVIPDVAGVARFLREARAVARLSHPHIILTYDAARADAREYLAMEYIAGSDLERRVRDYGPLGLRDAARFAAQAAAGLAHAHAHGIVHRDIKPGNLLLAGTGPLDEQVVKITDFGLARFYDAVRDRQADLTRAEDFFGTIDFMAPEQALDPRSVDGRTDIYSLGCTLFYLLTGRPPFSGRTWADRVEARVLCDAPPIGSYRPEVPASFSRVLSRMLARTPADRFDLAAQVAAGLQPFFETQLSRRPLEKRKSMPPAKAAESRGTFAGLQPAVPTRPRRSSAGMIVLILWLFLCGIAGGLAFLSRPEPMRDPNPRPVAESHEIALRPEPPSGPPQIEVPIPVIPSPPIVAPPVEPPEQKPVPPPPVLPTDLFTAEAKHSRPGDKIRDDYLKKVRELFALDYARHNPEAKRELAQTLFGQGCAAQPGSSEQYALFFETKRLAIELGDANLALEAVDELVRGFESEAEGLRMKYAILGSMLEKNSSKALRSIFEVAPQVVEQAERLDQYEMAIAAAQTAAEAARRQKDLAGMNSWSKRAGALQEACQAFKKVRMARAVLAEKPNEPSANRIVGQHYCFRKGEWAMGLPYLAQSGEDEIQFLAQRELEHPTNGDKGEELGEDYLRAAESRPPAERAGLERRALVWFQFARPNLDDVRRKAVDEKIELLARRYPDAVMGVRQSFKGPRVGYHSLALTPDDRHLVSACHDSLVRGFDMSGFSHEYTLEGHSNHVAAVAMHPRAAIALSGGLDQILRVWDLNQRRLLKELHGHQLLIQSLAYSPSGVHALSLAYDHYRSGLGAEVYWWDLRSGHVLHRLEGHEGLVLAVAIAPDARFLCTGGRDASVRLWNPRTGKEIQRFHTQHPVTSLAIGPAGRLVMAGTDHGEIYLWETAQGRQLRHWETHGKGITAAQFMHQGRDLLTSDQDGHLCLWDFETQKELFPFAKLKAAIRHFTLTRDGTRAVTCSEDRILRLWGIPDLRRLLPPA